MRASWRVNRPWVAPVEWASGVEAMQRGHGGNPQDRAASLCVNSSPLFPVPCSLFPTTAAKSNHAP
ncbi:MAG: hypothetical protein F6K55_08465 [Moorea sp. SIO4A3]|nr:hypothetical protein [Moorena sp. SIO4A3]